MPLEMCRGPSCAFNVPQRKALLLWGCKSSSYRHGLGARRCLSRSSIFDCLPDHNVQLVASIFWLVNDYLRQGPARVPQLLAVQHAHQEPSGPQRYDGYLNLGCGTDESPAAPGWHPVSPGGDCLFYFDVG